MMHAPEASLEWRFYLGGDRCPAGFTAVAATATYDDAAGYGYDFGTRPNGESPFFFSVKVPEGNFRVRLTLGDPEAASATAVKAESRRLMLEEVRTDPGSFCTRSFSLNVRTSLLPGGGSVRLKPREIGHLNWDDKLTLEFNGPCPRVQTVEITKDKSVPTVFLAGDSTVTDQRDEPWASWGQMLPRFFSDRIAVANHAESGESLRSFVGEKRLEKVLSEMKAGDWLLIQFGHNDQKETGEGVGPFTSYKSSLRRFIVEARKKGAQPVLVTSMLRRRFDQSGRIIDTLAPYPEAMRKVAAEEKVPLIDLNAMSRTLFEAMGPEGSKRAFVHYPAGTFPGQREELKDDSHFSAYGAYQLAKCVVEGIKKEVPSLAEHLLNDTPPFDPARPDPVGQWNLPPSPAANAQRPEGS
jgi:lysophospholipase L1-like esterase